MTLSLKRFAFLCCLLIFIVSCAPQTGAPTLSLDSVTSEPLPTTVLETQPTDTATPFVINPAQPEVAVNPLTGLPVQDASLLDLPAALVSIAHFPVTARPQAGLSFAPFVFEVYITEGATRFLAAFYGEFPQPEPDISGNCAVRSEPFAQTDHLLGNRAWWDANQNHLEDAWERGVGGVCINLYDVDGNLLQQTTTDSNGYFAFNVPAGQYFIEAVKPPGMEFVQKDAGDESQDSDVDQVTGRSEAVDVTSTRLDLDVGLILLDDPLSTSKLAPPHVGPVRSGRLVYADIAASLPGSCLIFAYASSEVLVELPTCAFVDHILQGGGYMLEIERMKELVRARRDTNTQAYYTSNTFSAGAPEGGEPATRLDVYFAWLNQSAWAYDAASQTWWRYVDYADPASAGILHPETDRLTNRQLQFENVIVLFAYHDVISPRNLEIHLEQDWVGDALVFRDGKVYEVRWSTRATEEEIRSGLRKPIQFYYPDETTLFPLKPGRTWVTVVTPLTAVTPRGNGNWLLQFDQPPGAK
jgi:hypothetical protein